MEEKKKAPEEKRDIEEICRNCRHWDQTRAMDIGVGYYTSKCRSPKVVCGYAEDGCPIDGIQAWDDGGMTEIDFGEEFGCVHFEAKEEQNDLQENN